MNQIFTKKGIVLIGLPLFTIFTQLFIRLILGKDFNTIGITLGSLGVGQLFPFIYFDHFVANKILGINPKYEMKNGKFVVNYELKSNYSNNKEIDEIKNILYFAIFLNLALFMVTVYFGITGNILLHTIFGLISCLVSWYFLIFK
jgi:hypothetical protein